MTIKYKLTFRGLKIEPVNVIKETECFITYTHESKWLKDWDRREAKITTEHRYFDTFEDARRHAVSRVNGRIDSTRAELKKLLETLERLESEGE